MDNDKQAQIELLVKQIMDVFQLKQTDSIKNTPKRVAKMLVNELFVGLDNGKFPEYTMFKIDDNTKNNEPIVVENISVYSICEHHFLPFIGKATFKYIPNEEIIGLSKIPRIIDFLSRKPQLQERLTSEIFDTFRKILHTDNISIELTCEHLCAKIRGIKDACVMKTKRTGGIFKD